MERLVDYFAVVGYDFDKEDCTPSLRGKVNVRIPETDWKDTRFIAGIELFCQPAGWYTSKEKLPSTFFVSVLTNEEGNQQYCAVHTFSEPIRANSLTHNARSHRKDYANSTNIINNNNSQTDILSNGLSNSDLSHGDDYIDEQMCRVENEDTNELHEKLDVDDSEITSKYAPKCLVLLSRIQDFRILKNCLGIIYTVYIENLTLSIENLIAKLLLIKVPPPGSTQLRFTIGASDKQALQIPLSSQLPVTRSCVSVLLQQLGILNVLNILCAALTDQKLLFYSCSYVRLTDACNALTALMYPFKYSYPYIPILPKHLLEYTSSPTPFLIGIHSSLKNDVIDLLDVITVDLDGGVISVPECVHLPVIPEPYYTAVVQALTKVLCPDLIVADWAYPPEQVQSSEPERLDKEIRAIFLRLFSHLLMGYRLCLQVCRIHPNPFIRFQKELFLTMRGFNIPNTNPSNEFVPKLLDSQAFSLFVQDNGPPYRRLHKFDEVVAEAPFRIQTDISDVQAALKYNKQIASDLYVNENPNHMALAERIPKPSPGSYERTTQRKFPRLSATAVQAFVEENRATVERERCVKHPKTLPKKRVPEGERVGCLVSSAASSRRLEVLRNCLMFIFESRTLEIKKIFQAVLRAMKSRAIRRALIHELYDYSIKHSTLDNQQFEYVSRLVNSALQDSSGQLDEFYLAADLLPIMTSFIRKLSPTVTQFLYSVAQEHPVWWSSSFWEEAFFNDAQDHIRSLYQSNLNHETVVQLSSVSSFSPTESLSRKKEKLIERRRDNRECMDIAAAELQQWEGKNEKVKADISSAEESVVYSQVKHYAQRMVFMLVPLDSSLASRVKLLRYAQPEESSNSFVTGSWHESLNGSAEDLTCADENISSSVSRFIGKFVDRVCAEAYISNELSKDLIRKIATMVDMQIDSLEDVFKESNRLPPIMKPKLLQPQLLGGESFVLDQPLRAYLAYDGRATATGGFIGGPALLPAEGALFLTTYRIIFIGVPCDALASEQVVIRSFPVSSLFKDKPFKVADFPHISSMEKSLQNGMQLRSSTFQLLVLAFDEEVSAYEQEAFYKHLHSLRYPSTIAGSFAISSTSSMRKYLESTGEQSTGTKMSTARIVYKQVKRRTGMNKPNRLSRLITTDGKSKTLYYASNLGSTERLPVIDEAMSKTLSDKDTINRLLQRSCEGDYRRMGLIGVEGSKFRLSRINRLFSVCRSYPTCIVVPSVVTDEQLKSLSHCHQQNKFPAVVWIHSTTKAIFLRAGSIRSRTANALFKHAQQKLSDEGLIGSSSEEEKFLLVVASLSSLLSRPSSLVRHGSLTSLLSVEDDNVSLASSRGSLAYLNTAPRVSSSRKWSTLTRSNGKLGTELSSPRIVSRSSASCSATLAQTAIRNAIVKQAQLYVLIDKSQSKNLRNEAQGKVAFVPLQLADPKQIRTTFKIFVKSCLPVQVPLPTSPGGSFDQQQSSSSTYLKGVEESSWLDQVSELIQTSGSIVDLLDLHGASVMLALDDTSDVTPQLSSLSQILMDPHYRTMSGFQTLIEKEWLSFGHRFSHRNQFSNVQSSGFTPVFLMFLDAVYQIHQQFPMSFEFNDFFIEVIAYHYVSNRFSTFLLDSDFERLDAGILFEKQSKTKITHRTAPRTSSSDATTATRSDRRTKNLWEYIEKAHARSPVFFNPLYSSTYFSSPVLRPVSCVCRLKVWPYYYREVLGEGPSYDGLLNELSSGTSHNQHEATETSEAWGGATGRRVVNLCYDNVKEAQPDSIRMLFNKIEALQRELNQPIDTWSTRWSKIDNCTYQKHVPARVLEARSEVRSLHKLTSADVIQKVRDTSQTSETSSIASDIDTYPPPSPVTVSTQVFRTSEVEVRTYEGYLWKQGALMRNWKMRFFVLDTTKHELRQYDRRTDVLSKNIIDLKDLESARRIDTVSNLPKEAQEKAFFEVRIAKRAYYFIADNSDAADAWVDNLQTAMQ